VILNGLLIRIGNKDSIARLLAVDGVHPLNSPRCDNNRSRDCNPEQVFPVSADIALACRRSPIRAGPTGRASALPVLGNTCRYCRPCRVPAHPPRGGWLPTQPAEGKTMDQPTQAVPAARRHYPATPPPTCIACLTPRPPAGGAR